MQNESQVDKLCEYGNGVKVQLIIFVKANYSSAQSAFLWYKLLITPQGNGFHTLSLQSLRGQQRDPWGAMFHCLVCIQHQDLAHWPQYCAKRYRTNWRISGTRRQWQGVTIMSPLAWALSASNEWLPRGGHCQVRTNVAQTATSPTRRDVFELDGRAKPLVAKTDAETFQSVVVKLLYVLIRVRANILLESDSYARGSWRALWRPKENYRES